MLKVYVSSDKFKQTTCICNYTQVTRTSKGIRKNHVPQVCVCTISSHQESCRLFPQTWASPVWGLRCFSFSTTAMDGWVDESFAFSKTKVFSASLSPARLSVFFCFILDFCSLEMGTPFKLKNCWQNSYDSESKSTGKVTCVCGN